MSDDRWSQPWKHYDELEKVPTGLSDERLQEIERQAKEDERAFTYVGELPRLVEELLAEVRRLQKENEEMHNQILEAGERDY